MKLNQQFFQDVIIFDCALFFCKGSLYFSDNCILINEYTEFTAVKNDKKKFNCILEASYAVFNAKKTFANVF